MNVIAISLGTCAATLTGGALALRFRDRLHLILGFSAGAVIAVAFFDLLPEALSLAGNTHGPAAITSLAALGFLAYMVLDRVTLSHMGTKLATGARLRRGRVGAGSLTVHSFLDGVGIGLGFQVSPAVGLIVAVAVLTHDFSDGINTVGLVLKNAGSRRQAARWLAFDAAAPVVGAASTLAFHPSPDDLGMALAVFGGFFLYIGASDLLPEAYHAHPTALSTVMTLLGAGLMYVAIQLAGS
jgi:ZIP family zinc transporter